MDVCILCKNKYDKLFKPDEKLLDTKLSSVIKFVLRVQSLEFPPDFLICTECSLALIQTDFFLRRLSQVFPDIRDIGEQNSIKGEQSSDEEETDANNSSKNRKSAFDWTFYCTNCEYITTNSKLYKNHLKSKHNSDDPRIYKCMFCAQLYQRRNTIKTHIECVHENKPRPTRKRRKTIAFDSPNVLSGTTGQQVANYTSLTDTNNDSPQVFDPDLPYEFVCTHCNYKTIQTKFFKRHMSTRHKVDDNRIYKCKLCPSTYARKFAFNNHIAYEHEKKPKPQRRKSIPADISLNETVGDLLLLKIEEEEKVKNSFFQGDNANILEEHMAIVHQNDITNTNGHDFDTTNPEEHDHQQQQRDEDKEHVFQVPQTKPRNQLSACENPSVDWVFRCSYCDFESRKKKAFKTHLSDVHNIHDSEVYKCTYCTTAYQRFNLLQRHVTNKHNIDLTSMSDTGTESDASYVQTPKKEKREVTPIKSIRSEKPMVTENEEWHTPIKSFKSSTAKAKSCVVCYKVFSSVEKLSSHMEKRHGSGEIKGFINRNCQFHSLEKDEAHLFSEKSLAAKLECQYPGCSKRFTKLSKMKQHMQEKHQI